MVGGSIRRPFHIPLIPWGMHSFFYSLTKGKFNAIYMAPHERAPIARFYAR